MKIKKWLEITSVDYGCTIYTDDEIYNQTRDDNKEIDYVRVQDNGVVTFHTKKNITKVK